MKARIQLCKSDKTDSTFFSSGDKMYGILSPERNIVKGTNCEMLIVAKTEHYTPGGYYLICEANKQFIVEKLARITKIGTNGVREMFIGEQGTVAPLDSVEEIIASTYSGKFKELPRPHGVFLDRYIKNYNKGQKIVYIDVQTYGYDPNKKVRVMSNGTILITPWDENIVEKNVEKVIQDDKSIINDLEKIQNDRVNKTLTANLDESLQKLMDELDPDETEEYKLFGELDHPEPDFDEMFRKIIEEIDANQKEAYKVKEDEPEDLINEIFIECINKGYTFGQFMDMLKIEAIENEREKADLERQLEAEKAEKNRLIREHELRSWGSILTGLYPETVPADNSIKIKIEIDDNAIHITMDVPDDMVEGILEIIEIIKLLNS